MKGLLALLGATVLGWLLLNLIGALLVGAIARAILPGRDKVGWFTTVAIGFLGGLLGKLAAFAAGWHRLGIVKVFAVSVVGALVLLIAHRIWSASRTKRGATTA